LAHEGLSLAAGETREIPVTLRVLGEGDLAGAVVLLSNDGPPLRTLLRAEAKPLLACAAPDPCIESTFDRETGTCLQVARPDGAACESPDRCLTATICQQGRCVGAPRVCDDGDVCTRDRCEPSVGCVHESQLASCTVSGPCKVPVCDPISGCGERDAPEGAGCGVRDCVRKSVCRAGQCAEEPVLEGETCGHAGPCSDAGSCRAGLCEESSLPAVRRRFTYAADGPGAAILAAPVLDEEGNLYFAERDEGGVFLHSLTRDGAERWRSEPLARSDAAPGQHLLWGMRLVHLAPECTLTVIDRDTGQLSRQERLRANAAAFEVLGCHAASSAPQGQLAISGAACEGTADPSCRPFFGLLKPDLTFAPRFIGKPVRGAPQVAPLVHDGAGRFAMVVTAPGETPTMHGTDAGG
ncbi:MAG: hypothetical protein ACK4N5_23725, partial [Myxococcales bacterium]